MLLNLQKKAWMSGLTLRCDTCYSANRTRLPLFLPGNSVSCALGGGSAYGAGQMTLICRQAGLQSDGCV